MSELLLKNKKREATKTVASVQDKRPLMRKTADQETAVDFNNPSPAQISYLQRTMGNQAIRRAVQRPVIQRKMTLGPVGDKYEQEADAVAAQVVGKLNGSQSEVAQRQEDEDELQMKPQFHLMPISTVQRHEEEEELQMKPLLQRQEEEEELQMKPSSTMDGGDISSDIEGEIQGAKGGGRPLDSNTQSSMGKAFNADFSGVNIHTNGQSDTLNRSLQARAFTSGQDIFFRSGEYNPNSGGGQELLAHELTHMVQQNGRGNVQRQPQTDTVSINQTAPDNLLSLKRRKMHLDFVRIKKKDTHIAKMLLSKMNLAKEPDDAYGHWWIEIGDKTGGAMQGGNWTPIESFGWWPNQSVNIKQTFKGVPGELNKGETNDPHHGDDAKTEYHPVKMVDDTDDYETVRNEVLTDIRQFANGFKGSWNWRLGWGKNCHTFLDRLKKKTHLHHQKGSRWLLRPHNTQSLSDVAEAEAEAEEAAHTLNTIKESGFVDIGDDMLDYLDTSILTSNLELTIDDYTDLNIETQTEILEYIGVSAGMMNSYLRRAFGEDGEALFIDVEPEETTESEN